MFAMMDKDGRAYCTCSIRAEEGQCDKRCIVPIMIAASMKGERIWEY